MWEDQELVRSERELSAFEQPEVDPADEAFEQWLAGLGEGGGVSPLPSASSFAAAAVRRVRRWVRAGLVWLAEAVFSLALKFVFIVGFCAGVRLVHRLFFAAVLALSVVGASGCAHHTTAAQRAFYRSLAPAARREFTSRRPYIRPQ